MSFVPALLTPTELPSVMQSTALALGVLAFAERGLEGHSTVHSAAVQVLTEDRNAFLHGLSEDEALARLKQGYGLYSREPFNVANTLDAARTFISGFGQSLLHTAQQAKSADRDTVRTAYQRGAFTVLGLLPPQVIPGVTGYGTPSKYKEVRARWNMLSLEGAALAFASGAVPTEDTRRARSTLNQTLQLIEAFQYALDGRDDAPHRPNIFVQPLSTIPIYHGLQRLSRGKYDKAADTFSWLSQRRLAAHQRTLVEVFFAEAKRLQAEQARAEQRPAPEVYDLYVNTEDAFRYTPRFIPHTVTDALVSVFRDSLSDMAARNAPPIEAIDFIGRAKKPWQPGLYVYAGDIYRERALRKLGLERIASLKLLDDFYDHAMSAVSEGAADKATVLAARADTVELLAQEYSLGADRETVAAEHARRAADLWKASGRLPEALAMHVMAAGFQRSAEHLVSAQVRALADSIEQTAPHPRQTPQSWQPPVKAAYHDAIGKFFDSGNNASAPMRAHAFADAIGIVGEDTTPEGLAYIAQLHGQRAQAYVEATRHDIKFLPALKTAVVDFHRAAAKVYGGPTFYEHTSVVDTYLTTVSALLRKGETEAARKALDVLSDQLQTHQQALPTGVNTEWAEAIPLDRKLEPN